MIQLIKNIKTMLDTYGWTVYNETAEKKANYPYIVFNFENATSEGDQDIHFLDVELYYMSNDGNTSILEEKAELIWKDFHRKYHIDDKCQFSIYRNTRSRLTNEDNPHIKGRLLTFEVRYFSREV